LNEALANQENLEREVNTQKEIMKQMEINRKEYITKLKHELLTVESRFQQRIEYMEMSSQDFMSRAAENLQLYMTEKEGHEKTASDLASKIEELAQQKVDVIDMKQVVNNLEMKSEDYHSLIAFQLVEDIKRMTNDKSSLNS